MEWDNYPINMDMEAMDREWEWGMDKWEWGMDKWDRMDRLSQMDLLEIL